jgi:hypothetical protein
MVNPLLIDCLVPGRFVLLSSSLRKGCANIGKGCANIGKGLGNAIPMPRRSFPATSCNGFQIINGSAAE